METKDEMTEMDYRICVIIDDLIAAGNTVENAHRLVFAAVKDDK